MRIVKMSINGLKITEETIMSKLGEIEACEICDNLNCDLGETSKAQRESNNYCYYQVLPELGEQ